MPNWSTEHYVIPIICIWAQDSVPGNVKDDADVTDQASHGFGLYADNFISVFRPGEFIFSILHFRSLFCLSHQPVTRCSID